MTGFSEDLEQLLEAEREIDAPLPVQRAQLLARLSPLLAVPTVLTVGAASVTTAAQATSSAAGGLLKAKLGAVAVSAALLGGVVGATGHAYFTALPSRPAVPQPVPASPRGAPSQTAPQAPPAMEPPPAVTTAPGTPSAPETSAPETSATRSQRPLPARSLRAERLLLEAASAALMRGDPESAMIALQQHAQRFPNGALAEEREALVARARAAPRKPR